MKCAECGKPIQKGTLCLPCSLEQEELDNEEKQEVFKPMKKQTVVEK